MNHNAPGAHGKGGAAERAGGLSGAACLLVLLFALLPAFGCGGDGSAADAGTAASSTSTAAQPQSQTQTQAQAADFNGNNDVSVPAGPDGPPVLPPSPGQPPTSLTFVSRSVDPEVSAPGGTLTFTARLQGQATAVSIKVFKRDSDTAILTVPLTATGGSNGVATWSGNAAAPADRGVYRYSANAENAGTAVEMTGVSGWTFCVGDPAADCSG